MWTQFMDMHSGGGQKLEWAYVEEPDRFYSPNAQLMSVEDYINQKGIKIVRAEEIAPHERTGSLNEEGFVWR